MKRRVNIVTRPSPVIRAGALRPVMINGHPRRGEGRFPPGHKYPARFVRRTRRNPGGLHVGRQLHPEPCFQRVLR